MTNIPPSSSPKKMGKLAYAMAPQNRIKSFMFLGAAGVSLALVGYFVAENGHNQASDVKASVAQAPTTVKFINGAHSSAIYQKMYNKQQHAAANKAVTENKSYIPGFLGKPQANNILTSGAPQHPATPPKVVHLAVPVTPQPAPQAENVSAKNQMVGDQNVMKEMNLVQKQWMPTPMKVVYSALPKTQTPTAQGGTSQRMAGNGVAGHPAVLSTGKPAPVPQVPSDIVIGAGRMAYGVLDVQLNSNRPTPVLAQIEDGPLAGTRLLGSFKTEDNRLVVKFTRASLKNGISFPVDAVMVNPKVNQAYLASSVNHHYFYRYAMLLGGAFLTGFGQTIQQAGSTTTYGAGGVTQTFQPQSTGQAALSALGQVGAAVGQVGVTAYQTPNTVRLKLGQGIGILFLSAVSRSDIAGKNGTGALGASSSQAGAKLGKGLTPVGAYGSNYGGYGTGYGSYNGAYAQQPNTGLQSVNTQ